MYICINIQFYILLGGVATTKSTFGITLQRYFFLDDVNCTGNESNIFDCWYPSKLHNCKVAWKEEAGALCGITPGS